MIITINGKNCTKELLRSIENTTRPLRNWSTVNTLSKVIAIQIDDMVFYQIPDDNKIIGFNNIWHTVRYLTDAKYREQTDNAI